MTHGPDVFSLWRQAGRGLWARSRRWTVAALVGMLAVAVGSCHDKPLEPRGPDHFRVVVISLDGLRPDAITTTFAPTLLRIAKEGAATATAETQFPSLTLPSHTSMVTGLTPEHHGINWNDDTTSHPSVPPLVT